MKRITLMIAVLFVASLAAYADIAPPKQEKTPKPKPGVNTTLFIKLDRNATEAVLRIPRSQVKQLRAELEQIDDSEDNTASVETPGESSILRTQTVVSGMFLSLAVVFGGIWFVRSGKISSTKGKTLVALTVVTAAASFVYANIGPPPEARSITSSLFTRGVHMYKQASGKIKVETMTNRDVIELIVPDPKTDTSEE
ncbi:MAG: hypothetical protein KBD94_03585 [Pyrinomonadaceae bacterium]|nr:hypothetical protein [Pyrinomonadaceae bacterium]